MGNTVYENNLQVPNGADKETIQILIVDDEGPIRRLLSRMLDINGYRCTQAATAREARKHLKNQRVDIILCDVNMPEESGIDFIQYALTEYPDTAAIMVTAADDPVMAETAFSLGAYGYITKPFGPHEVVISVSNALRRRRLEIENRLNRENLEQMVAKRTDELGDMLKKLQKAMDGIIQAMAATVEMRDPYTAGHQRRVSDLSGAIAEEMGLSEDQIYGIKMTGDIHDLGKISVPAEILSKPTRLTDIEFSLIKTHPEVGYEILKDIEFPWPVAEIVVQHHEKVDGSGYPRGLSGDGISREARIMTVADVVEAMASHRPYRPALGIDAALDEVKKNRGVLYDPDAVDACLKIFKEKRYSLD